MILAFHGDVENPKRLCVKVAASCFENAIRIGRRLYVSISFHKFSLEALCYLVTPHQLFGERLHINELHGIRIFLPDLAVIENGERLQGEPRQDRIARPVIGDSGNRITHF
jgi:hypothetical protein